MSDELKPCPTPEEQVKMQEILIKARDRILSKKMFVCSNEDGTPVAQMTSGISDAMLEVYNFIKPRTDERAEMQAAIRELRRVIEIAKEWEFNPFERNNQSDFYKILERTLSNTKKWSEDDQ